MSRTVFALCGDNKAQCWAPVTEGPFRLQGRPGISGGEIYCLGRTPIVGYVYSLQCVEVLLAWNQSPWT